MTKRGKRHWEAEESMITPLLLTVDDGDTDEGMIGECDSVSTFEIYTEHVGDKRIMCFLELLERLSGAFATAKRADAHWTLITVYSEDEPLNCTSVASAATFYRLQWKHNH